MKCIRPVVFACGLIMLSLVAFALQNTPSATRQSGQAQTQQPGQQPQPAQPSQPPQPSQPSQPQASQPAPANQPPSIDDQVKVLTQELNLTGDQQAKTKTALEDQRQQASAVIGDNTLSRDDKVQKIRALREATIAKVRGILNDDQKRKLDDMLGEPQEQPHPKEPPK